jgi:hypothetical protein
MPVKPWSWLDLELVPACEDLSEWDWSNKEQIERQTELGRLVRFGLGVFCQVSASCHISAMTLNNTAAAPKTIRPHDALFIHKR